MVTSKTMIGGVLSEQVEGVIIEDLEVSGD
jgi:hypothetical protein